MVTLEPTKAVKVRLREKGQDRGFQRPVSVCQKDAR
jgi:hypothetical protein